MSENGWSKSDKKVAHAALDKAWAAEFAETKLKIIKQAADMRHTDDMEQLERDMHEIRKNWRTVYNHSFTFMDSKLAATTASVILPMKIWRRFRNGNNKFCEMKLNLLKSGTNEERMNRRRKTTNKVCLFPCSRQQAGRSTATHTVVKRFTHSNFSGCLPIHHKAA